MTVFSSEKQHRPSTCGKDCDFCTEDDDKIQVSVSPRRLDLPPPKDKKAKMEIVNKNPYPIYFKAGTSNVDVFKPHPDNGCIPPNSKVTVVVEFYDSARPARRHEEVVITASIRPFEKSATNGDNVCPYCLESVDASKHRKKSKRIRSQEYVDKKERYINNTDSKAKHHVLDNGEIFQSQSFDRRYSSPRKDTQQQRYMYNNDSQAKHHVQDNGDPFQSQSFDRRYSTPRKDTLTTEYVKQHFLNQDLRQSCYDETSEVGRKEQPTRRETCMNGYHEIEEICLHAFVHRPTGGGCECNNCYHLNILPAHAMKVDDFLHTRVSKERKLSDTQIISETNLKRRRAEALEKRASKEKRKDEASERRESKEKRWDETLERKASKEKKKDEALERRASKEKRNGEASERRASKDKRKDGTSERRATKAEDTMKEQGEDSAERTKDRRKIPHIQARVVSSDEDKAPAEISESSSAPELSELFSKVKGQVEERFKKIISENDFIKKVEKAKVKKQKKRLQEESQSTTTESASSAQDVEKPREEIPPPRKWKELLLSIDQKCTTLLRLSWTAFLVSLFLLIFVIGLIVFCHTQTGQTVLVENIGGHFLPCFYNFFG